MRRPILGGGGWRGRQVELSEPSRGGLVCAGRPGERAGGWRPDAASQPASQRDEMKPIRVALAR